MKKLLLAAVAMLTMGGAVAANAQDGPDHRGGPQMHHDGGPGGPGRGGPGMRRGPHRNNWGNHNRGRYFWHGRYYHNRYRHNGGWMYR